MKIENSSWFIQDNSFSRSFLGYAAQIEIKPIENQNQIILTFMKDANTKSQPIICSNLEVAFKTVDYYSKQKTFDKLMEKLANGDDII